MELSLIHWALYDGLMSYNVGWTRADSTLQHMFSIDKLYLSFPLSGMIFYQFPIETFMLSDFPMGSMVAHNVS